ncbi:MAG: YggS family pyridoxal phosphate-dependent enzyme [Actinomycetota bacterium]|nr:YggS family pyridoxal phosphate-dependent enzyme [Actinomycetota bacterium]
MVAALARVRTRLHDACVAVGRSPREVTLIVVTKRFPVSDAAILLDLGVTDLGESRDQEAKVKAAALPQAAWHFVGQVQTNKARSIAGYAAAVHSLDRAPVLAALAAGVRRADRRPLPVFVQVSLDADPSRAGVALDRVDELAAAVVAEPALELLGLMAVAPMTADPADAFARLAAASAALVRAHPGATAISAGMSGDLEQAVAGGATHLRIGTALLGSRGAGVG